MKQEHGFKDERMNLFKLKLYNWSLNDAIKYYKNDKFCLDYCIHKYYKYGCNKWICSYKHSINLYDLVFGNLQQRDYKQGALLCLYLMHKNVYNDKNAELFNIYALILYKTGKSQQDYKKSEEYYLKSLSIDNNYVDAHNNYAVLLTYQLNNYDKAEYHYNQSSTINPNTAIGHCNFADFLIDKTQKYELSLSHSDKACKLSPDLSYAHYIKAQSLYKLNRYDLSLKEYEKCLKLNKKDGKLGRYRVDDAQKQIVVFRTKLARQTCSKRSNWKRPCLSQMLTHWQMGIRRKKKKWEQ